MSDPSLRAYLRSSGPQTNSSGWYATGLNQTSQTMLLTTIAKCLPKTALGKVSVVTREVIVDPHRGGNANIHCKSTQGAIAGGVMWHKAGSNPNDSLSAHVTSSLPDFSKTSLATGWTFAGANDGTTMLDMRAVVVCAWRSQR